MNPNSQLVKNFNKIRISRYQSAAQIGTTTQRLRGTKIATHVCGICGLAYVNRYDLRRHQRKKHPIKADGSKSTLILPKHSGDSPNTVERSSTKTQVELPPLHHCHLDEGLPDNSQSSSVSSRFVDSGRHSCRVCGLHYARSSDLRRHHKNKHEINKHQKQAKLLCKSDNPPLTSSTSRPTIMSNSNPLFSDLSSALTQAIINNQSASRTNSSLRSDILLTALSNQLPSNGNITLANIATVICVCNMCGAQCSGYEELCTHYLSAHPFSANNATVTSWDWWKVLQSSNIFDISLWPSSLGTLIPSTVSQQSVGGGSSDQNNLLRTLNLQSQVAQVNCSSLGSVGPVIASNANVTHIDLTVDNNHIDNEEDNKDATRAQVKLTKSHENETVGNGSHVAAQREPVTVGDHLTRSKTSQQQQQHLQQLSPSKNSESEKICKRSRAPLGTHVCRICGLRYVYAGDLRRHEKRKHPGVIQKRKAEAAIIQVNDTKKEAEKPHVSTKGSISPTSDASSSGNRMRSSGEREGLHVCQLCGLRYMRSGDLRRHQVKKHELRPRTRRGPHYNEASVASTPSLLNPSTSKASPTSAAPAVSVPPSAIAPPVTSIPQLQPKVEPLVESLPADESMPPTSPNQSESIAEDVPPPCDPDPAVKSSPTGTKDESALPYTCDECNMSFRTIEVLRFHQMCLHPDVPFISSTENLATQNEEEDMPLNLPQLETPEFSPTAPTVSLRARKKVFATHECSLCGLSYVHRSDLRRHQRQKHKMMI